MGERKTEIKPKAKRGCAPASLEKNTDVQGEQISTVVNNSFRWSVYKPVKTDEETAERLNLFFQKCIDNKELPTVEKMCLALGVDRDTVLDWQRGKLGAVRAGIIKKAKQILASIDAELVATGHMNTVAYIFRAKNFYGMKDQSDVTVTHTSDTPDKTPAELAEKYIGSTVIDVEDFTVEKENDQPDC